MADDKVVDLDGRRPMYGDNYEAAESWLEDFARERPTALEELRALIRARDKSESIGGLESLIESLEHIRDAIGGEPP
jgi:hypothetical protein